MKTKRKNRAGGKADATKVVLSGSDQSVVTQPIPVSGERPGPKFFLRVRFDGAEHAFEREPDELHLAVELVRDERGRVVEQTWTTTIKVRVGMDKDLITPRPRGQGWEAHLWPVPEALGSSAAWRRPASRDWELVDEDRRHGKIWWRPASRPVEERVLTTYHVVETPEGGEPVGLHVGLIDSGKGLVEQTATYPSENLSALGWSVADGTKPNAVIWRRPHVKTGGRQ